jgi:hypothetical protein
MTGRILRSVFLFGAVCLVALSPASARQWNPDARAAAADYTQIIHAKPNGEFVFLWWAAPEAFPNDANTQMLKDVLSRYVFIGVAHGRNNGTGLAFDNIADLRITDAMGRQLTPIPASAAPEVAQALGALQALQTPMRPGTHWFVFEGSTIHSCMAGKLSVPFAGETYTYDMPIPGCPK